MKLFFKEKRYDEVINTVCEVHEYVGTPKTEYLRPLIEWLEIDIGDYNIKDLIKMAKNDNIMIPKYGLIKKGSYIFKYPNREIAIRGKSYYVKNTKELNSDNSTVINIINMHVIRIPKTGAVRYRCTNCGNFYTSLWDDTPFNYCPYCGRPIKGINKRGIK